MAREATRSLRKKEFFPIDIEDQWGYLTQSWKGKKVPKKGRARIRWPDGHQEVVSLQFTNREMEVGDHGKTSQATCKIVCFEMMHHGYKQLIELQAVDVSEFLPKKSNTPSA